MTIASAVVVFASFGAIVVKAGDDAGVRDFIRQSSGQSFSGIFRRAEQPRYMAYAPRVVTYRPANLPSAFSDAYSDTGPTARRYFPKQAAKAPTVKVAAKGAGISHATAYCVRLCDGYEFPLGPAADRASQEDTCQQACPASPSAVFVAPAGSDGIAGGRDRSGTLYTAMPNAFAYRTSVSPSCGCSNVEGQGVARPSIRHDVTLRRGDIVMTERGLSVYSRSGSMARFTSIHVDGSISEGFRKKLKALEAGTIARAPTTTRQAKADLPSLDFQVQSDVSEMPRSKPEPGQPTAFVRIVPRTPPMLR